MCETLQSDMDTTVIYYTANREDDAFESKIRQHLLSVIGDLPLISVSQKPIENFGTNICVGPQDWCDASAFQQLLIGLKAAKTKFAIAAESDCLYPPEYFTFTPDRDDQAYRYTNTCILYSWISRRNQGLFWHKPFSEGAQMCGREYWIHRLETVISEAASRNGQQYVEGQFLNNIEGNPGIVFKTRDQYSWTGENPVISFKTAHGLRRYSAVGGRNGANGYNDLNNAAESFPYWGTAEDVRGKKMGF